MRSLWAAGAAIAFVIGNAATAANAAEIRLAEQFSMGYLQFNVMKRDKLIEKYATQRGLKDFKVSWQRFNGPVAMNEALLSNSTDIVSGGVPGLITLWDKTQGTSFEVKGIRALSSQPFLLNTANPDIKSIKDFSERDRIAVPSIKVSVQAVLLQMAAAEAYGEANYGKLDPLTVSMSPPDATIALLSGAGGVSSAFSVPRSSSSNWRRRASTPCCRRSMYWGRIRLRWHGLRRGSARTIPSFTQPSSTR
jgi:NitT/TauT family transport system substrate-binding protein